MRLEPISLLADNYAWLLTGERGEAVVVDPSEAAPITDLVRTRGLTLRAILATHHHPDHVGGVEELQSLFPEATFYSSRYDVERGRVPDSALPLDDGASIDLLNDRFDVLAVPGHTLGAIAYHVRGAAVLLTGDTLFGAGCGRLFEGDAATMHASLERLVALPPRTRVACGHEYTEKNLRFALSVEPDHGAVLDRLDAVRALRARGEPSVPSTLELERLTNPFLRVGDPALSRACGSANALETFTELRRRRDAF